MSMQGMLNRLGDYKRRNMHSGADGNLGGGNSNSPENCGWCEEFDNGPCRVPFRLWMQCCDHHPEEYPEVCKKAFQNFNKCLEMDEVRQTS